jgi:hypothetical protein
MVGVALRKSYTLVRSLYSFPLNKFYYLTINIMKDVIWFKCNNLTVIKWQYHKMVKWRNRLFVESICKCWNIIEHSWEIINKHKVTWCGKCEHSKHIKHWMTQTDEYHIYNEMIARCNNIKHHKYKSYWWRWIKVLWKSFDEFYRDMWIRPWKEYSIDRINNDGNYCKENCRRATIYEQSHNKRTSHKITYNWKTQTMKQRSIELWIPYDKIRARINSYWRTIEKSFNT